MMDFSIFKKLTINGVELKQVFINGVQVWKSGYKNRVKYATEADGVTIYNGGLGYKNGYRVRSGGAEATNTSSTVSGYIPVKGLDVIRVGGTTKTFNNGATAQAINASDSSFNHLGQIVGNASGYGIFGTGAAWVAYNSNSVVQRDSYWEWVAPPDASGIAYIRVTGCTKNSAGLYNELIVTINEEIE